VRRKHQQQEHLKVTEATYTYVSIDEERKPVPVELIEPVPA
jgi:acyl-CoA hydrolase